MGADRADRGGSAHPGRGTSAPGRRAANQATGRERGLPAASEQKLPEFLEWFLMQR